MRRDWKLLATMASLPLGSIGWILDQIGRAQTVKDLPIIKWALSPVFPPIVFSVGVVFYAWHWIELKTRRQDAGFRLDASERKTAKRRAILAATLAILIIVVAPLL